MLPGRPARRSRPAPGRAAACAGCGYGATVSPPRVPVRAPPPRLGGRSPKPSRVWGKRATSRGVYGERGGASRWGLGMVWVLLGGRGRAGVGSAVCGGSYAGGRRPGCCPVAAVVWVAASGGPRGGRGDGSSAAGAAHSVVPSRGAPLAGWRLGGRVERRAPEVTTPTVVALVPAALASAVRRSRCGRDPIASLAAGGDGTRGGGGGLFCGVVRRASSA